MAIDYTNNPASIDWPTLKQDLIDDNFHNGRTTDQLKLSFENSRLQIYALRQKRCVGTARALSDGVGNAYVIDVWTQSEFRGMGIATRMMRRLLAAGPGQHFYLQTDDAGAFYEKLGFRPQPEGLSLVSGIYLENGD